MGITARLLSILIVFFLGIGCDSSTTFNDWPSISREHKPWTRWWWHGSALTREGITIELESYAKAGLGGVEITPIYGVHGAEDKFVQFLSDEWMELLVHTLREAERLGLGVDMATGTGWPFGGPWVSDTDACKYIVHNVYIVSGGQSVQEKIIRTQEPFLRAVGTQVYEVHDNAELEGRKVAGTRKEPLQKFDPGNIKIEQLEQPVEANDDLQSLALDQVQFERQLPLVALVAYPESGESIDLMSSVDTDGTLKWVAPPGEWQIYALFQGWHGKMVERAGPGGEGNVIDHFSSSALSNYLKKFDSAFSRHNITSLRGFFNDSYEVDDARGAADWTPTLIEEFSRRRGYNLLDHLPQLFVEGAGEAEESEKVLYDYRLTISEMLLGNFTQPWADWAHNKNKIVRNQAHGAPANILDLYAAVDIPETEGIEPLRIRMATSAGHVTGKKLISSESATWLDEHFLSGLGDIKQNVDRYLANGVNHILYHGTSYSPPDEPWPGWLFYAAVHLNPRNPQWADFAALNRYVARCQSLLQQGTPYNDVLLYYPVADRFSTRGAEMVEHFDSPVNAFKGSEFMEAADTLLSGGYTFDFISDQQLQGVRYSEGQILTAAGVQYKTVVIPQCKYMPLATMRKLMTLVDDGAKVIFYKGPPESIPGLSATSEDQQEFKSSLEVMSQKIPAAHVTLPEQLGAAGITREVLGELGLSFTRRKLENGNVLYFIVNTSESSFQGALPLNAKARSVVIRDPMTGRTGSGRLSSTNSEALLTLQLHPRQSIMLELTDEPATSPEFEFASAEQPAATLTDWKVEFVSGGPVLPAPVELDSPAAWTSLPDPELQRFSGTGVYSTTFERAAAASARWVLNLGAVHGSATIILNGDSLATLIDAPYEIALDSPKVEEVNELQVRISNLMANRIADMDRQGIPWKKFYNVNFPARKAENRRNGIFRAGEWKPLISGLQGPVFLSPATRIAPTF
jgi:hypothetical protein